MAFVNEGLRTCIYLGWQLAVVVSGLGSVC